MFECVLGGKLFMCKVMFGAEPKDYEIIDFISKKYYRLRFSQATVTESKETSRNPKRIQQEVQKQIQNTGIGTKSQQQRKQKNSRKGKRGIGAGNTMPRFSFLYKTHRVLAPCLLN